MLRTAAHCCTARVERQGRRPCTSYAQGGFGWHTGCFLAAFCAVPYFA
jgi:hypothetical protein